MPLYEYVCGACGRQFTWLVGVVADPAAPTCDRCGAMRAERKAVSRFARIRTEEQAMDALGDPSGFGDMDDPRTMERWAKEMGGEFGEGLGDEFDEYVDDAAYGSDGDEARLE